MHTDVYYCTCRTGGVVAVICMATVYLVIQQGGASHEFYLHTFDSISDARAYRRSAEQATYATSDPIPIPARLERDLAAVEAVVAAAIAMV